MRGGKNLCVPAGKPARDRHTGSVWSQACPMRRFGKTHGKGGLMHWKALMTCVCVVVTLSLGMAGHPCGAQASSAPSPTASRRPALFKDSRQSLAIARAQGRKSVVLLVVAKPGEAAAVAEQAARLGGDVRYRDDEVGYLRVRISPDRATEFAEFGQIETVAMDYDDSYPNRLGVDRQASARETPAKAPTTEQGSQSVTEWPPRLSDYPLRHPYTPLRDLDAADFLAKHPTWDGRGVTIALLDGNLDLLLPEFQTAYTADGKTVPKIADYLNVTDPRDDGDINPQWVNMQENVTSNAGKVSFQGKTFTVPRDGAYRIGLFSERRFNMESNAAYIDQDIDRNGNPKGDDGLFGVLWDEATNDVWVDTNRDLSFADEKAMTDYIKHQDVGIFGKDDPKTPVRDCIGFAVQTDQKNKFVSINVGIYQHATEIMGSVVGNKLPNGQLQGVAPGARLVSVFYGVSNAHGLIEGLITAFKHPLVDLIVLEQSVAIASLPYLLADATHPMSLVAQRLIQRYHKLLFVPGDNSPAFGFVAEDGLAPGAVSVGGYQNKESYRMNWGLVPENDDNLHWGALSHGPSGTGALKPNLIAPSGQMSTDPGYRKGGSFKGLYQLPPGYSVDGGTSTATPMAAGATALVVSAAKQSGIPYDATRLKAAITGSTRYIPRLAAHEQGNGLIQVGAAYELLKKLQAAEPVTITSRAPVRTRLSHLLLTPDEGVGLYEREGWAVGDRRERTITLTRTSGPAEPMTFSLSWQGNDGTFSSAESVTLPLGSPVGVPVTVTAKKEGAHSAVLSIDHPSIPGHAQRVLAAIVVPYRFTADNGYSVKADMTPPRPGDVGVFVDVPRGTAALTFSASAPNVSLSLIGPDKDGLYPCSYEPAAATKPCSVSRPQPGVWEINVDSKIEWTYDPETPVPLKATPVTITATILGIDVTAKPAAPGALKADSSQPLSLALENRLGKAAAAAISVELGSATRRSATIGQGEQHLYEIMVPKGATSLLARMSGVSDTRADLDVYLLDCTEPEKAPEEKAVELEKGNKAPPAPKPTCGTAAKAADVGPDGEIDVANPRPGRWVIVVDGYSVFGGPVSYQYLDFFTHPIFGSVAVADPPEERKVSAAWMAKANAWAATLPPPPRQLAGRLVAVSHDVFAWVGPFNQRQQQAVPLGAADLWFGEKTTGAVDGR